MVWEGGNRGRGGRAGAEIWGKAGSPGQHVSRGTPEAVTRPLFPGPGGPPARPSGQGCLREGWKQGARGCDLGSSIWGHRGGWVFSKVGRFSATELFALSDHTVHAVPVRPCSPPSDGPSTGPCCGRVETGGARAISGAARSKDSKVPVTRHPLKFPEAVLPLTSSSKEGPGAREPERSRGVLLRLGGWKQGARGARGG